MLYIYMLYIYMLYIYMLYICYKYIYIYVLYIYIYVIYIYNPNHRPVVHNQTMNLLKMKFKYKRRAYTQHGDPQ